MKNAVFINCTALSEYALKPLPSGLSSLHSVLDYALQLPDSEAVSVLCLDREKEVLEKAISEMKSVPAEKISFSALAEWDSSALFGVFLSSGKEYSNLFYLYGDTPLLDIDAAKRMYENHLIYSAQYSFSDGGPYGITPEIIAMEIVDALKVLSDRERIKIERDTVFTVIQRDINSFDIETEITEKDLRMLRISLTADSKRNFMMLEEFMKAGIKGEKRLINLTSGDQRMLRTLPACYMIQISDKCFQSCMYCPYPLVNPEHRNGSSFMDFDSYCKILEKISSFSEDAVISLSLWGEPSSHPRIEEFILKTLEYEKFSLLVETSGIGWKKGTIESISAKTRQARDGRLMWILSLDTDSKEIYKAVRGEGFEEALDAADLLVKCFPSTAYIQAVRMNENDGVLEKFYKSWKAAGKKVIVQKYDSFCGFLPDRKVTDISPLKRIPCWHLKRDMNILIDGTVPVCREDLAKNTVLGNIFTDDIEKIWQQGERCYLSHLDGKYEGICERCDEYYTYNF